MRVIIINDEDARNLLEQLELDKHRATFRFGPNIAQMLSSRGFTEAELEMLNTEMHRSFHFVVTRWLREHGATVTK